MEKKQGKIKSIISSKVFIGVICFFIGGGIVLEASPESSATTTDDSKATIARLEQENKELKDLLASKEIANFSKEDKVKDEVEAPVSSEEIELSNGNYVAGENFDAGTYDVVAVKGSGNVISSNMFSGGINAMMGVGDSEFYAKEYKNIKLPNKTTLKIDGVTVKLIRKK